MTALENEAATVKNIHLDATEHGDKIIFMHSVQAGAANKSFGIAVAQLAGVPRPVIQFAKSKLKELEAQSYQHQSQPSQGDLFAAVVEKETHAVVEELKAIDPNELSPKAAMDLVYRLKAMI